MNTRIETRKRAARVVKALVITLALTAGVSGSAMAASEEPSFTARAQISQGFAPRGSDRMSTTERATIPSEATSFIARVQSSQGIVSSGTMSSGAVGPIGQGEAESFITRVQASQRIAGNQKS
jgi:hypothetical protein